MMAILLACRAPDPQPMPETSEPEAIVHALEARGMGVVSGEAARLSSDCCQEDNCLLANPDNDYIGWWLPRGEGQQSPNPRERDDEMSHIWRLRPDEAVLAVGTTPPEAAYFSYRSYLDDRYDPSIAGRDRIMVNLGDSLNQFVIGTEGGSPFSSRFALIATADANTLQTVREALAAAGVSEGAINVDVIAADSAAMPDGVPPILGLHDEADTFRMNNRLALFRDEAEGEAYLEDPPISLWRITPRAEGPPQPLAQLPLRSRGSGSTESPWEEAVDELQAAILASHPGYRHIVLPTVVTDDGDDCPPGCNRDTFFAVTAHYVLPDDVDAFLVVFGPNHERTGKSAYSNFSVIETEKLSSLDAIHSREMPGSARGYLPDHPLVDDLYAWRVSRSCDLADPYCISVPYECPGFGSLVQGSVAFRAYPEPSTGTGPSADELVHDRAILFAKWPPEP